MRAGNLQPTLAAATAASSAAMGFEVYLEHYRGSFGDKWMWTPVVLSPPLAVAGVAGMFSERAAKTVLPAVSALYLADGAVGVWTHVQGVRKKPGGFENATYNLVMGPPLLAPAAFMAIGVLGLLAPIMNRRS
jgi:hypothetical protein